MSIRRVELEIDRAVWLRGESGASFLRRAQDSKMCCAGILAKACGFEDKDLVGIETIAGLHRSVSSSKQRMIENNPVLMPFLGDHDADSPAALSLYRINDDENLSETGREYELDKMFREFGVDLKFVGEQLNVILKCNICGERECNGECETDESES